MARGNAREDIVCEDADRQRFLRDNPKNLKLDKSELTARLTAAADFKRRAHIS